MRMLEYGKNINGDSDFNLLIYQELNMFSCINVHIVDVHHFAIVEYRFFFFNVFFLLWA